MENLDFHLSIERSIGLMYRFLNSRRKKPATSAQTIQNQIERLLNNADLELLMETYDTVVTSSKQLKPLINKITPFFRKSK